MIFHNTKLINLWETAVSLFLFVLLVVSFSSPRDADNLSLRFENVCISRRGVLFYCTSILNLQLSTKLIPVHLPSRTFLINKVKGTATSLSNSTIRLYETTSGNK